MIRLAYARNTISNVIILRNMSQNIRHLMKKTKIEELTKAIRSQASLQKHVDWNMYKS